MVECNQGHRWIYSALHCTAEVVCSVKATVLIGLLQYGLRHTALCRDVLKSFFFFFFLPPLLTSQHGLRSRRFSKVIFPPEREIILFIQTAYDGAFARLSSSITSSSTQLQFLWSHLLFFLAFNRFNQEASKTKRQQMYFRYLLTIEWVMMMIMMIYLLIHFNNTVINTQILLLIITVVIIIIYLLVEVGRRSSSH